MAISDNIQLNKSQLCAMLRKHADIDTDDYFVNMAAHEDFTIGPWLFELDTRGCLAKDKSLYYIYRAIHPDTDIATHRLVFDCSYDAYDGVEFFGKFSDFTLIEDHTEIKDTEDLLDVTEEYIYETDGSWG